VLLLQIERHLRTYRMSPSRFGRNAANDPCLVFDLLDGRQLRPATAARIRYYLDRAAALEAEDVQ
jgi:hypothetical protein